MREAASGSQGRPRRWAVYVTVAVTVALHLVFSGHISVFGVAPSLPLVLTAAISFSYGARAGCVAGFALGTLSDLAGSGPIGLAALTGCIAGYVLGAGRRNVLPEGIAAPSAKFFVVALACHAASLAAFVLLDLGVALSWAAVGKVVLSSVLDLGAAVALFAVFARITGTDTATSGGIRLP